MFKIGEFSKLSRVPVKTLRYYDEIGLLKPVEVDSFTGYRYYSASQLPKLNRILVLKELGLSLDQVATLLQDDLSVEQIRGMLRLKRAELRERVSEEQARLARVEARLMQIEQGGKMPTHEVAIKKIPPLRVASIRGIIPAYNQPGQLWGELYGVLGAQKIPFTGPCLTTYHDTEYKEQEVDAEVCQPVNASPRELGRIKIVDLPAVSMACVVHAGTYDTLNEAYNALTSWMEQNQYRIAGPMREVYLKSAEQGEVRQDDPSYVTEIQCPIEK
jgi:effector-binding domain-containing protein